MEIGGAQKYVKLNPPLPVISKTYGPGFLRSMSPSGGTIEFTSPIAATAEKPQEALDIACEAHAPINLSGRLSLTKGESVATLALEDQRSRAAFAELLTIVRKDQHIALCAHEDVEATDRYTGFSDIFIEPKTLPEIDWDDLDLQQTFLGSAFAAPLFITGMTGGLERGALINRRLAAAAAELGLPMGVGSQRLAIEHPKHRDIFTLKQHEPSLFLLGNVGVSQLRPGSAWDFCRAAIEMIDADALAIHVNVLQEVVQIEGDRRFRGLLEAIAEVCDASPVPIVIKEVGAGVDVNTAAELFACGVAAIDVGGKGGTSWSHIEGLRADDAITPKVAQTFRDWGIPTAHSLTSLRQQFPDKTITATGGIRDGLMVAQALACGADMVGIGLPLLRAALESEAAVFQTLQTFIRELRTAMICAGVTRPHKLTERLRQRTSPLLQQRQQRS